MTDVSLPTALKLLADIGAVCSEFEDQTLMDLPCKRIQADECWSFVAAKQKNVTPELLEKGHAGDF
jgi:hypothetical protein